MFLDLVLGLFKYMFDFKLDLIIVRWLFIGRMNFKVLVVFFFSYIGFGGVGGISGVICGVIFDYYFWLDGWFGSQLVVGFFFVE